MIHRKLLGATVIAAVIALSACDGSSSPTSPSTFRTSRSFSNSLSRSGVLHATKACPEYTGNAGDFCTITSSNLKEIEKGSKVVYASSLVGGKLDTDLILYPAGRGNSVIFGHVTLDLTTTPPHGLVTFSGGTGKFKHFQAVIAVTPLNGGPDWNWDGPYSFSDTGDDSNWGGSQR